MERGVVKKREVLRLTLRNLGAMELWRVIPEFVLWEFGKNGNTNSIPPFPKRGTARQQGDVGHVM